MKTRIDYGPRIVYCDSRGEYHREDGPAVIRVSGTELWYYKGEFHRVDGPAIIYADGEEQWYINGKYIK